MINRNTYLQQEKRGIITKTTKDTQSNKSQHINQAIYSNVLNIQVAFPAHCRSTFMLHFIQVQLSSKSPSVAVARSSKISSILTTIQIRYHKELRCYHTEGYQVDASNYP